MAASAAASGGDGGGGCGGGSTKQPEASQPGAHHSRVPLPPEPTHAWSALMIDHVEETPHSAWRLAKHIGPPLHTASGQQYVLSAHTVPGGSHAAPPA